MSSVLGELKKYGVTIMWVLMLKQMGGSTVEGGERGTETPAWPCHFLRGGSGWCHVHCTAESSHGLLRTLCGGGAQPGPSPGFHGSLTRSEMILQKDKGSHRQHLHAQERKLILFIHLLEFRVILLLLYHCPPGLLQTLCGLKTNLTMHIVPSLRVSTHGLGQMEEE